MKLADLLNNITVIKRPNFAANLTVDGVQCDSRRIRAGDLFVAIPGVKDDGMRYVESALVKGAIAIVSVKPCPTGINMPWIQVEDARSVLATLACAIHQNPSHHMSIHAVTGTNGKTTTTGLIRDFLQSTGQNTGLISTVQCEYGSRVIASNRTTPDACELQTLLEAMRAHGCTDVAMEVSSHAIDQHRIGGIRFKTVAFTNLSRDHLDYHREMESYFEVKTRIFMSLAEQSNQRGTVVINQDDPYGARLIKKCAESSLETITYGVNQTAIVRAENVTLKPNGTTFMMHTPWGSADIEARLLGRYNVYNLLCAAAVALQNGVELSKIALAISSAQPRWGRLEHITDIPLPCNVFVDYAHTDDALQNVLTTLREITPGKLIVVFGCGGNRDTTKRPIMGRVASTLADHVIVTSDNPRGEDPMTIINEIATGIVPGKAICNFIPDRRDAILAALQIADNGDTVLIAGKGHENYQEFENRVVPFDDREQVRILSSNIRRGK